MKKVIAFLLALALALGGLIFAHAAVSANQTDLLIYPTLELGDPAAVKGLTAQMTFTCGDHLRWQTAHTFGGETTAAFLYDSKGTPSPLSYDLAEFSLSLPVGTSTTTTGSFPLRNTGYGSMIRAVFQETPKGGSATRELRLADYMDYYTPDYDLYFDSPDSNSTEGFDVMSWTVAESYYHVDKGCYDALTAAFRFPVQPDSTATVTTETNDAGLLNGIEFQMENAPDLHLVSNVTGEGIWLVPVFQDAQGTPLSYESPAGHGIYFIPWAHVETVRYSTGEKSILTPDVSRAALVVPLSETMTIAHMQIDAASGKAWMLTCDQENYTLTVFDLTAGRELATLPLLPRTPDTDPGGWFFMDEGYLVAVMGDQLALVDTATHALLLTAPDAYGQTYGAHYYNLHTGTVRYDGTTLILADTADYRSASFWTAAWKQNELLYYGEYDCSLTTGNDHWYYSYINADSYPITLK